MNYIFGLIVLIFIFLLSFLPIVGAYIGFLSVVRDDNNKWQKENSDAYLIHGGR
jgi:hypothetical protein